MRSDDPSDVSIATMEVEQLERPPLLSTGGNGSVASPVAGSRLLYRPSSRATRINSMEGVVEQPQQQQRIRLASSVLSVATIIKTEPRSDSSPPPPPPSSASSLPPANSPSATPVRRSRSRIHTG